MGQSVPQQHPAVVLRTHYTQLRFALALAIVCILSLSGAVVILAAEDGARTSDAPRTLRMPAHAVAHGGAPVPDLDVRRYDGGPEEGTRGVVAVAPPTTRHDGGPEEGTRGR